MHHDAYSTYKNICIMIVTRFRTDLFLPLSLALIQRVLSSSMFYVIQTKTHIKSFIFCSFHLALAKEKHKCTDILNSHLCLLPWLHG